MGFKNRGEGGDGDGEGEVKEIKGLERGKGGVEREGKGVVKIRKLR
jgi:hypothetical protein